MWGKVPIFATLSVPRGVYHRNEKYPFCDFSSIQPYLNIVKRLEIGPMDVSDFNAWSITNLLQQFMPKLEELEVRVFYPGAFTSVDALVAVDLKPQLVPGLKSLTVDGAYIPLANPVLGQLEKLELQNYRGLGRLYDHSDSWLAALSKWTCLNELNLDGFLVALPLDDVVPVVLPNLRCLDVRDTPDHIRQFLQCVDLPTCTSCNLVAIVYDACGYDGNDDTDSPDNVYTLHGAPIFLALLPASHCPLSDFEPVANTITVTTTQAHVLMMAANGSRLSLDVEHPSPAFSVRRALLRAALRTAMPANTDPDAQCPVEELSIIGDLSVLASTREGAVDGTNEGDWSTMLRTFPLLRSLALTDVSPGLVPPQACTALAHALHPRATPALQSFVLKGVKGPSPNFVRALAGMLKRRMSEWGPDGRLDEIEIEWAMGRGTEREWQRVIEWTVEKLEDSVGSVGVDCVEECLSVMVVTYDCP